jgi:hypothetical protein
MMQILNVMFCGHEDDAEVLWLDDFSEKKKQERNLFFLVHPQKCHLLEGN